MESSCELMSVSYHKRTNRITTSNRVKPNFKHKQGKRGMLISCQLIRTLKPLHEAAEEYERRFANVPKAVKNLSPKFKRCLIQARMVIMVRLFAVRTTARS